MYQLYEETPENLSRMKRGLAPKRLNPKTGKIELIDIDQELYLNSQEVHEVIAEQQSKIDLYRSIGPEVSRRF